MRLLLVDDDIHLVRSLVAALSPWYRVSMAGTVAEAERAISSASFDLYIIDIGLPDGSGMELARQIRWRQPLAVILMLTANQGTPSKVRSLDAGADDYVTKPFSLRELEARLRALSRRMPASNDIRVGDLLIKTTSGQVYCRGQEVSLRKKERAILESLMSAPGNAFSRRRLTELAWDRDALPASNVPSLHIGRLRHALAKAKSTQFIHTVPGVGYRLGPGERTTDGRSR